MDKLAALLKSLSDKNRLRIIGLLNRKACCVCELAAVLDISQPAVSKHLAKLKRAGVIESEQNGFWTNYFLNELDDPCAANIVNNTLMSVRLSDQFRGDSLKLDTADRSRLCE